MPKKPKYTDKQLFEAVKKAKSYRQVCSLLGLKPQVDNIKKRIINLNISTEHFNIHKKNYTKNIKYIGETISDLVILDAFVERTNNKNNSYFLCKCNLCNNKQFKVLCVNVLRKSTTSCGCRRDQYEKIRGSNNVNWTGFGEIRGRVFKCIKKSAFDRGLDFNLTAEYIWKLFLKQNRKCALTDIEICFGSCDKHQSKTASLDRIDNSKGYIKGNVQWVHKKINIMRGSNTIEDFYWLCKKVVDNYDKIHKG